MKTWVYQWIKANSVILVNAGSLIGTTVITSGLGFIFWWLAARRFPLEAVGIASASISTMMLLGTFCMLGLGTLLITELPRQPGQEGRLISTALIVVGGVGGSVGAIFAVLAPSVSVEFLPLRASIENMLVFALGVSFTAITLVLDQALVGLLSGGMQLWRNSLFAVAKLAFLFVSGLWLSQETGITIYATWVLGNAFSLGALAGIALWKGKWSGKIHLPQWNLLHKLGAAALQHHMLNLTLQAPGLLMPLMVTVLLTAKMNAWFYVSSMIASFVTMIPTALTIVLHAMNSAQQSSLGRKARVTIGLALAACIIANCLIQFDTKQVLGLFGNSYAEQATWSLRILTLQALPLIIKTHYISICRIHDRIGRAMVGMLPGGFFELACGAMGAHFDGLTGLCLGQTIVICIESICMFPTVYRTLRFAGVAAEAALPASDEEVKPIWLLDTAILVSIGPGYKMKAVQPPSGYTPGATHAKRQRIGSGIEVCKKSKAERDRGNNRDRLRLKAIRLQRF